MHIEMKYTVDGRTVSGDQWGAEIIKEVYGEAETNAQRIASATRCAVHHKTATAKINRSTGHIEIEGCCDALAQEVARRISS